MIFLAHQVGHTVSTSDFVAPAAGGLNFRTYGHTRKRPYATFHMFRNLIPKVATSG
jgi:hypothetical protein